MRAYVCKCECERERIEGEKEREREGEELKSAFRSQIKTDDGHSLFPLDAFLTLH